MFDKTASLFGVFEIEAFFSVSTVYLSKIFTIFILKLHAVGDVGEGQRGELVDNLVGAEVERLTLEGLHLQIFQDEVVRRMTLVDSVLH